jgi:hypothetical protein
MCATRALFHQHWVRFAQKTDEEITGVNAVAISMVIGNRRDRPEWGDGQGVGSRRQWNVSKERCLRSRQSLTHG